jgi:broad specificity phosphatase PhoE
MMFRRFAAVAGTALLVLTAAAPTRVAPSTLVMLVRHAEKAPGTGDVPLSEAGRARARALAEIGRESAIEAIITTQFIRTRQTAEPLASALNITPLVVPAQADVAKHAADVVTAVRQQAGRAVLVVGHSNTIPSIVAALGGLRFADLCEAEYDRLFLVVIDVEGVVRTVRSRFGEPTPVGPGCAEMR